MKPNKPYTEYLYLLLMQRTAQYNNAVYKHHNDPEEYYCEYAELFNIANELNENYKIKAYNEIEAYYPHVEIIHRDYKKPVRVIREWSCL